MSLAALLAPALLAPAIWLAAQLGEPAGVVLDAGTGAAFLVLAVVGLRRGVRAPALLAALTAATWYAGALLPALLHLHRGVVAQLVLAYPGLRPRPRWSLAVVVAAYLPVVVPELAGSPWFAGLVAGGLLVASGRRRLRGPLVDWHAAGVAHAGAMLIAAAWLVPIAMRAAESPRVLALVAYCSSLLGVAVLLAGDLLLGRAAETTLAGAAIDLGEVLDRGTLRDRLARAIGDPELKLVYAIDDRYVDELGQPFDPGPRREAATPVVDGGRQVALLLHDPAVRLTPTIAEPIAAATALALRNVVLHADVRAQADAVAASRLRLLKAEDAARSQFARALELGPRRRLGIVAEIVAGLADPVESSRIAEYIARADRDLARLGRGLLPAELETGPLGPPLTRLGAQLGLSLTTRVSPGTEGLPATHRAAVWFVCAEALTNIAKHAGTSTAAVTIRLTDHWVAAVIADRGRGGASPTGGSGLRGLAGRAEALGGRLEIESQAGRGSTVRALFPLSAATAGAR